MMMKELGKYTHDGFFDILIKGYKNIIKVGCRPVTFTEAKILITRIRKAKKKKEKLCYFCLIQKNITTAKKCLTPWSTPPEEKLLKKIEHYINTYKGEKE